MAALTNWMRKKKHPAWRKVCNAWVDVLFSPPISRRDFSSLEEWNPWTTWCKSWEEFLSSREKPPKSEKQKRYMFSELFPIAELTRDKMEQAKTVRLIMQQTTHQNESLRNQNSILTKNCEELQRRLDAEKQIRIQNDHVNQNNLKMQIDLIKITEDERDDFSYKLQQAQAKCRELELELEKIRSYNQGQLVASKQKNGCQINIKNDIIYIPDRQFNLPRPYAQLENGKGESLLDRDTIKHIVEKLGKVTTLNVFEWLNKLRDEYVIWRLSGKDIEQILYRCMDSSIFSSLTPPVRTCQISWLFTCKEIAESFIPNLDNLLETEKMRTDDNVLQYFHRMFMIYSVTGDLGFPSRDDHEYIYAIHKGLFPHLRREVEYTGYEDYEEIKCAALSAEYSWLVSEQERQNLYWKKRKAGPGCPPRIAIWKRLQKYPVPFEEIDNAPYWDLLVHLSRYEDLKTRKPR